MSKQPSQAVKRRQVLALIEELALVRRIKFGPIYTSIHCDFAIAMKIKFYPVDNAFIELAKVRIVEGKPSGIPTRHDVLNFVGDVCADFKDVLEDYGLPAYRITRERRLKALLT